MQLTAILCEGSYEQAVIDVLLDHDALTLTRKDLIDGGPLRVRDAKHFFERHIMRRSDIEVYVLRILDSKREVFKVPKFFQAQTRVENIITAPEIEILFILGKNKFTDYQKYKSKLKPSDYVKQMMKVHEIKSYEFVYHYYNENLEELIQAIKAYKQKTPKQHEKSLANLLK